MTVALRESVVNAIKHGNRNDESRRVTVDFVMDGPSLEVAVRDEGTGFDVAGVPDPVAEENLLKPDGAASSSCGPSWTASTTRSPRAAAPSSG
jgi:anti-sigma regulatory factor (Ser/Thr protein kinase)